jgi:integrase/recombinase XerC/integrase/recombinase XerD
MGTITRLRPPAGVTLDAAADGYLATLRHPENAGTLRVYAGPLRALVARFGEDADPAMLDQQAVAEWFTGRWGGRSAARWNGALNALRSAAAYWADQGWTAADPARRLRRRTIAPDRDRALQREQVDQLLDDAQHPLRDRLLWRMLYETAARSAELLALDVPDLDMPNRCARVRRKGGAMDVIVWQTGTARLLPRYLKGRAEGPLFVTERRARVPLPPGDVDSRGRARLGYR